MRTPKLTIAVALSVLAVLGGTLSYTGFLAVGVVADYLGTGRLVAGLLIGGVFARFPSIREGRLRTVGLLPKPARQPLMLALLTGCLLVFLSRADYVPAAFTGLTVAFLLAYRWARRALFDRMLAPVFNFAGTNRSAGVDDGVIDGEFRERKD